jgi:hypothetical protein
MIDPKTPAGRVFCVCGHEVQWHSRHDNPGRCLLQNADGSECPCTKTRPETVHVGDTVYRIYPMAASDEPTAGPSVSHPKENEMNEEAKTKMLAVIPFLRDAMAQAKEEGEPAIGILATKPDGAGRIIAHFRAAEFVDDLCDVLGVPKENTEDERLDVAAARINQMVRDAGGTVTSSVIGGDYKEHLGEDDCG